jgi:hypothetical protein
VTQFASNNLHTWLVLVNLYLNFCEAISEACIFGEGPTDGFCGVLEPSQSSLHVRVSEYGSRDLVNHSVTSFVNLEKFNVLDINYSG